MIVTEGTFGDADKIKGKDQFEIQIDAPTS